MSDEGEDDIDEDSGNNAKKSENNAGGQPDCEDISSDEEWVWRNLNWYLRVQSSKNKFSSSRFQFYENEISVRHVFQKYTVLFIISNENRK